jgi:hypothetical protein
MGARRLRVGGLWLRAGWQARRWGAARPGCGTTVGCGARTLVLMRDYGRARDYRRRGSLPSASTSTVAAISLLRRASRSATVLLRWGCDGAWVWVEKRSPVRLVWIGFPMVMPLFPSVFPLRYSLSYAFGLWPSGIVGAGLRAAVWWCSPCAACGKKENIRRPVCQGGLRNKGVWGE